MTTRHDGLATAWAVALPTVAAALAGLMACASAGDTASADAATGTAGRAPRYDDCAFAAQLSDWNVIDDQTVLVYVSGREPYVLKLFRPATQLTFDLRLGFEDRNRNGWLCAGDADNVIVPDEIPERISIVSMQRVSRDEAKALLQARDAAQRARRQGGTAPAVTLPAGEPLRSDSERAAEK